MREPRTFFALGRGGQYIIVVPEYQLVTVFTSNIVDDTLRPLRYFEEYILHSVMEG